MSKGKRELQRQIAYEAARILTEYRTDNIAYACQKAAAKLGISHRQQMPTKEEIELALREQQRLFRGAEQSAVLQRLRESALQAMQALHRFNPVLVGSVFNGTADSNSHVQLHLYADTPEEVLYTLSDLHIPWQERQRTFNFSSGHRREIPIFQFNADEVVYELLVFPADTPHMRPLDPQDNQPIQGASYKQLTALVA